MAVAVQAEALNFPATHVVHGEHADRPAPVLKLPAEHAVHVAEVSMPSPVLYVPARQLEQDWAPVDVHPP